MARRILAGVVGFAAVVALAACVEREPQAPMRPEFAVQPGQCSFTAASQLAGDYFTDNDTLRVVRSLIGDMRQAGAGSDVARDKGFDVFTHVAANVAANPDEQAGSALVNALIACMYTDAAELPLAFPPEDFTTALDANQNGAFAVRGGEFDETGVVYARLNQYSGVYPVVGDWTASLDSPPAPRRVLLYGKPVGIDRPLQYDWRTFPHDATFNPPVVVALCIDAFAVGNETKMVKKKDAEDTGYLPFVDAALFDPNTTSCGSTAVAFGSWSPSSFGSSLFRLAMDLLGPRPLAASAVVFPGGLGGTTGGIRTEYGPEVVDTVVLRFVTDPGNARVCPTEPCAPAQTLDTVTVEATLDGDPVGGVSIDLAAINNNGNFLNLLGTHPQTTGEDGTVTFRDLGIDKPGGYRLVASGVVVDRSGVVVPATSRKGNIRP